MNYFIFLLFYICFGLSVRNVTGFYRFVFYPVGIIQRFEIYRLVTYNFLHNNFGHLFVNSVFFLVVSFFGPSGSDLLFIYLFCITVPVTIQLIKKSGDGLYQLAGSSASNFALLFYVIPFNDHPFGYLVGTGFLIYELLKFKDSSTVGHDVHVYGIFTGTVLSLLTNFVL